MKALASAVFLSGLLLSAVTTPAGAGAPHTLTPIDESGRPTGPPIPMPIPPGTPWGDAAIDESGRCIDGNFSDLGARDLKGNPATPSVAYSNCLARQGLTPVFGITFDAPLTITPNDEGIRGIIRYRPGQPIVVTVKLNGRTTARLILDTGADGSMVRPSLLAAAGVDLSRPAARGEASGIDGKVKVSYFAVDFEVAGHRVRVPRVAAFDTYDDGFADGLLGRDFLDRFKVVVDPAAGTVTLVPR